ncbi:hypothetical protein L3X38_028298 [Prunus dulcis]|uniref:Uncharacterized protein n=1 Tax=Prunus dulcis TaxID=3755 RepID=A0AAD4VQF8_PRUDU|nr:hypothetical protein L3X38_028298 [Prunus dulcis]
MVVVVRQWLWNIKWYAHSSRPAERGHIQCKEVRAFTNLAAGLTLVVIFSLEQVQQQVLDSGWVGFGAKNDSSSKSPARATVGATKMGWPEGGIGLSLGPRRGTKQLTPAWRQP